MRKIARIHYDTWWSTQTLWTWKYDGELVTYEHSLGSGSLCWVVRTNHKAAALHTDAALALTALRSNFTTFTHHQEVTIVPLPRSGSLAGLLYLSGLPRLSEPQLLGHRKTSLDTSLCTFQCSVVNNLNMISTEVGVSWRNIWMVRGGGFYRECPSGCLLKTLNSA